METLSITNHRSRIVAFMLSSIFHTSLIAYIASNIVRTESLLPEQQMIQISVMPASVAEKIVNAENSHNSRPQIKPIVRKAEAVEKNIISKPPAAKDAAEYSKLEPKSGKATNAKSSDSVITKPVFSANYLNNPAPKYPESAKRRRQQGNVLLMVKVLESGKAGKVSIHSSSGSQALDQAAVEAVSNWKFVPAKQDGEFVTASVIVPIDFKLH